MWSLMKTMENAVGTQRRGFALIHYFYHSLSIEPAEIKFGTLSYNVKLLTTHLVVKRFIRV